jgi:hypothetical protein
MRARRRGSTNWSTSLKYFGSIFSNDNKSIDVDNPFCLHCRANASTQLGSPPAGAAQFGPSLLRYGTYPDNSVNGLTWNAAVNLPIFKTRYTSNVQYMAFRQNDPFLNDATNGITFGTGPLVMPGGFQAIPGRGSERLVNAFHQQRAHSHLTSELTNTARVRYRSSRQYADIDLPQLRLCRWWFVDGAALTRDPHSYTRLNSRTIWKWQPNRIWAFGLGYFFERYTYRTARSTPPTKAARKPIYDPELAYRACVSAICGTPI